mmetsp:Transcript_17028/g.26306  ORF Transcript_17028/g.26306 Transcript_17028/m.26306 type:complete len:228 (+) Transcript_17028:241-924(+)
MRDNYVKDMTVQDADDIIAEFDSNQDKTINYDEFLNIFLPACNMSIRGYVANRRNYGSNRLPVHISTAAVRILEKEKELCKKRYETRMDLFKHIDHQKLKTFHEIGQGQVHISMTQLTRYLESNGFHPRTEDVEAILRRCDHDSDQQLSFDEFAELTELPGASNSGEENPEERPDDSPQKKELEEQIKKDESKKRRNSNDRLDANPKEDMDQQWERQEHEKRQQELK